MLKAKLHSNETAALNGTDATFKAMSGEIVRMDNGDPVMDANGWDLARGYLSHRGY